MIRITQSYLVLNLLNSLQNKGWTILYKDYPDGQRNGIGSQGVVFHCFKSLFDEYPDIVCVRSRIMLIIEVDTNYKENYSKKLGRFNNRKEEIISCLFDGDDSPPLGYRFAIAISSKRKIRESSPNIELWYYDRNKDKFMIN